MRGRREQPLLFVPLATNIIYSFEEHNEGKRECGVALLRFVLLLCTRLMHSDCVFVSEPWNCVCLGRALLVTVSEILSMLDLVDVLHSELERGVSANLLHKKGEDSRIGRGAR